jgi:hypothetical protein
MTIKPNITNTESINNIYLLIIMDNSNYFPRTNDNIDELDIDFLTVGEIVADTINVTTLNAGNIDLSDVVRSSGGTALNSNYIIVGDTSDLKVRNSFMKTQNTQAEGFASATYVNGSTFGDSTYQNNIFTIRGYIRKDGSLESQTGGISNVVQNGTGDYRIEFDSQSGVNPWVTCTAFNDNGIGYLCQVLKINPNDVTINTYNVKSFGLEDTNFFISISSSLL